MEINLRNACPQICENQVRLRDLEDPLPTGCRVQLVSGGVDQKSDSLVYVLIFKVLSEPTKFLMSVSSSGSLCKTKEKSLTLAPIQSTSSGFDRPLLYRLSCEARREQVVGDCGGYCMLEIGKSFFMYLFILFSSILYINL